MIHEVHAGRICDSLQAQQAKELESAKHTILAADSVISKQKSQIAIRDSQLQVQTDRIINQQKANQELRQEIRKQKGLTAAVTIASILGIIIIL